MNFFLRQAEAQRTSRLLVVLFVLAVIAVVVAVDSVIFVLVAAYNGQLAARSIPLWMVRHADVVWISTASVLGLIGFSSLFKISQLNGGGGVVARTLGGVRVSADTTDPLQRRLLNVVEEMSIASGVPMPEVYLLEQENGINAFAAGHNTANAAVAVTRGTLTTLNRAELQGVIAHEFSHILNGDMRLNIRLMGMLFGLMVIAIVGRTLLRLAPRSRSNSKNAGAAMMVLFAALVVMVIGYIGLFFGRLIQAAISRSRESLADASAVQFTRDPAGLRGALVKIGALMSGSKLSSPKADEVAHMLFAPGMSRLFATHPDLVERIRVLDPHFSDAEFEAVRATITAGTNDLGAHEDPLHLKRSASRGGPALTAAAVAGLVGNPGTDHVRLAETLRREAPEAVVMAARHPDSARALLLALALNADTDDQETRDRLLRFIELQLTPNVARAVASLEDDVKKLAAEQRMPALLRAFPALQQLPINERTQLLICLNMMMQREGYMPLYSYALRKLAQVQLTDGLQPRLQSKSLPLQALGNELQILFSVLAHYGNATPETVQQAYAAGMQHLYGSRGIPRFGVPVQWPARLDIALTSLDRLIPQAKQQLVEALVKTILSDQQLVVNEAELLRAVCGSIHCPLPPLMGAEA